MKCRIVDLITLLSKPKGKTREFKRDLSSPEGGKDLRRLRQHLRRPRKLSSLHEQPARDPYRWWSED